MLKAVELGDRLFNSSLVELIQVDEELLASAWEYFQRHSDKRYSLTDCLSFVVMGQRSLSEALAFDRHFVQAGFRVLPES
jgi:predicted nucleic acid-binding protein